MSDVKDDSIDPKADKVDLAGDGVVVDKTAPDPPTFKTNFDDLKILIHGHNLNFEDDVLKQYITLIENEFDLIYNDVEYDEKLINQIRLLYICYSIFLREDKIKKESMGGRSVEFSPVAPDFLKKIYVLDTDKILENRMKYNKKFTIWSYKK